MTQEARPERLDQLAVEVQGKEIRCQDGTVGHVAEVLVDPATERPSYLVWREAVVVTKEVSIPVDYVERVEGNRVVLRVTRDAIERLPHFWTAESSNTAAHGSAR